MKKRKQRRTIIFIIRQLREFLLTVDIPFFCVCVTEYPKLVFVYIRLSVYVSLTSLDSVLYDIVCFFLLRCFGPFIRDVPHSL